MDDELRSASLLGNLERVRELLDAGANIESKDFYTGETALHLAAKMGERSVVRLLLDRGANVNARNRDGFTPIIETSRRGDVKMVKLLLERGADANATNKLGVNPLFLVKDETILRMLIDAGADVKAKTKHGTTPIHVATTEEGGGYEKAIRVLVEKGADINARDIDGETPLHQPSFADRLSMVRLLIELGADMDIKDNFEGGIWSPFEMAKPRVREFLQEIRARKAARAAGEALTVKSVQELAAGLSGTAPKPGPRTYLPSGIPGRITRFMALPPPAPRRPPPAAPVAGVVVAPGAGAGPGPVRGGRKTRRRHKKK